MNRALTLKWFAVLGLASLFYLLAPRDVSPQMPLYLGMTSAAVIIWTFDLLPAVAVAAALTFLYLLTNMAPPEVVLGPWTTVLIWTTFGAAIFGEAMEKTGLAKRVALRCMLLTGGTFTGMLIGFAIGGIILGLLLASGVIGFFSAVLSNEAFISWGWRIAFIMSAGLLFVGSYIRSSVHETKDFAEAKAKMPEVKYPLLDAFKRYPKMMVACMGARLIDGVAFNTFAVFSLSYLTQTRGLERSSALAVVMIASVVMSFFIPFWGYVADRIGKARVFGFCALLLGILGFPAFWVFHNYSDNYLYVCLALAVRCRIRRRVRDHVEPLLRQLRPLRPLFRHFFRLSVLGHLRCGPDADGGDHARGLEWRRALVSLRLSGLRWPHQRRLHPVDPASQQKGLSSCFAC